MNSNTEASEPRHLVCVVGARPNFMKMAPLLRAIEEHSSLKYTLVHTGQHYDRSLSDVFFALRRAQRARRSAVA